MGHNIVFSTIEALNENSTPVKNNLIQPKHFYELQATLDALDFILNQVPVEMIPSEATYSGQVYPITGYRVVESPPTHACVYRKYLTITDVSGGWITVSENIGDIEMEAGGDTLYSRVQIGDMVRVHTGWISGRFYKITDIDTENNRIELGGYSGSLIVAGDTLWLHRYYVPNFTRIESKEPKRCWNYTKSTCGWGGDICLKGRVTEYQGSDSVSCKNEACPDYDNTDSKFTRYAKDIKDICSRWCIRGKWIPTIITTETSTIVQDLAAYERQGPSLASLYGDVWGIILPMGKPAATGTEASKYTFHSSGYVFGSENRTGVFVSELDDIWQDGFIQSTNPTLVIDVVGDADTNDSTQYPAGNGITGELRNWLPMEGMSDYCVFDGD